MDRGFVGGELKIKSRGDAPWIKDGALRDWSAKTPVAIENTAVKKQFIGVTAKTEPLSIANDGPVVEIDAVAAHLEVAFEAHVDEARIVDVCSIDVTLAAFDAEVQKVGRSKIERTVHFEEVEGVGGATFNCALVEEVVGTATASEVGVESIEAEADVAGH